MCGACSAVKHVLRALDPKATDVHRFGRPSAGELNHDCMWRCLKALPELVRRRIWYERLEDIRHIERYLGRNGVVIRKFFLNVSKRE